MSRIREDAPRTHSPSTRAQPALLTCAFAGVFVLAAYTHVYALAVSVLIAQLVLASAPAPTASRAPAIARFVPIALGGSVATVLTARPSLLAGAGGTETGRVGAVDTGVLVGVAPGIAVLVLAALLSQMLRRDGRDGLVESLTQTVSVGVVVTLLTGWVAALQSFNGVPVVVQAAIAVVATTVVVHLPGPPALIGALAAVVSGSVSAVATVLVDDTIPYAFAVALGVSVSVFLVLGQAIAREWGSDPRRRVGVDAMLPLALVGPVVFLAGQLSML